jgi:hypothetical protein
MNNYDLEIEPHDEDIFNKAFDEIQYQNYDSVLKKHSKIHPDTLFILSADEDGDVWIKYYKGGKVQIAPAIITFDEFDEKKLK